MSLFEKILEPDGNSCANLHCPVCGNDYCHPYFVRVLQCDRMDVIEGKRICTIEGKDKFKGGYGRGSSVITTYECESGHYFDVALKFHKGTTTFEVTAIERPPNLPASALWRD